jgi:5-methylcytosine-specific restriction protein A
MRGVRWQKLRRRILIEEPWCGVCERAPSEQVDHITPIAWGGTDERSNLQGICRSCHENKTLSESRMGRGRGSSLRGEG